MIKFSHEKYCFNVVFDYINNYFILRIISIYLKILELSFPILENFINASGTVR